MTGTGAAAGSPRLAPPEARWASPPLPDPQVLAALRESLRLPEPVCRVLAARNLDHPEQAKIFLRPRLDHLAEPSLLTDGMRAAERVASAIRSGETILVTYYNAPHADRLRDVYEHLPPSSAERISTRASRGCTTTN